MVAAEDRGGADALRPSAQKEWVTGGDIPATRVNRHARFNRLQVAAANDDGRVGPGRGCGKRQFTSTGESGEPRVSIDTRFSRRA